MEHIIFLLLNFILIFVFIKVGKLFSYKKNKFHVFLPCVISFTLILGARYLRGNDYRHYQDLYNHGMVYEQKLFSIINNILHIISVSDTEVFFVYAFIFIVCAYPMLKIYSEVYKWIIPLFIPAFILMEEVLVRQALAYSFIFLFIAYINSNNITNYKKIIYCIVCAIATTLIHTACILPIVLILIFFCIRLSVFPLRLTLPIYLFFVIYFRYNVNFAYLNKLFLLVEGIDHFDVYVDENNSWFANDAINWAFERNKYLKPIEVVASLAFLYLGYKYLPLLKNRINDIKYKSIISFYNITFIGMCIYQGCFLMEIPRRIGEMFYVFWFIPMAYILYIINKNKLNIFQKILYYSMGFFIYPYVKYLFFNDSQVPYLFLWDK